MDLNHVCQVLPGMNIQLSGKRDNRNMPELLLWSSDGWQMALISMALAKMYLCMQKQWHGSLLEGPIDNDWCPRKNAHAIHVNDSDYFI